jgi:hypothetical protein
VRPCRHEQVTSRLNEFIDQEVAELLCLVAERHGLVSGQFLWVCFSLLKLRGPAIGFLRQDRDLYRPDPESATGRGKFVWLRTGWPHRL